MQIDSLHLTNFRNYPDFKAELSPLTLILGSNGIGKTNILESIVVLSTTKSHRVSRDRDLIKIGEETARIEGKIHHNGDKTSIAVAFSHNPAFLKTYFKNNTPIKGSEIVGHLKTVLFSPESMELIYGSPSVRRRFLNNLLCQINPDYIRQLWTYGRVLQERNRLLVSIYRGDASRDELSFWNEELVSSGEKIIDARERLISYLNDNTTGYYQTASGESNIISILYEPSVVLGNFAKKMNQEQQREIRAGNTLYGPHRDDFCIQIDNQPISTYGSRGEARSAILALKMSESQFHKYTTGQTPILLLDDVFSELDGARRAHLNKLINKTQTIITSTESHDLKPSLVKNARIINLNKPEKG